MKLTDFLAIIIPIICNGFLIFGFQEFISHKIQRKEKRKELIFNIVKILSNMVIEVYQLISLLIHKCSPGFGPIDLMQPVDFEKLWNPIAQNFVQLYDYVQIHETILKELNISFNNYFTSYQNTAFFLGQIIGKTLSPSDKQTIYNLLNDLKHSSIALNKQLENILLNDG